MIKASVSASVLLLMIGCSPGGEPTNGDSGLDVLNGSWVLDAVNGDHDPMALQISGAGGDELSGTLLGAAGGRTQTVHRSEDRRWCTELQGGALTG